MPFEINDFMCYFRVWWTTSVSARKIRGIMKDDKFHGGLVRSSSAKKNARGLQHVEDATKVFPKQVELCKKWILPSVCGG